MRKVVLKNVFEKMFTMFDRIQHTKRSLKLPSPECFLIVLFLNILSNINKTKYRPIGLIWGKSLEYINISLINFNLF